MRANRRKFTDKSLKRILKEILYGMEHLQQNRMVHSDIRPSLIGVPIKREDNFRLLDRLGDSSMPMLVQKKHLRTGKEIFMSPEMFRAILEGQTEIKYNPFKSDIFSLGLVILEAGLFESVQGIYDRSQKDLRKEALIQLVERFIQKYPEDYILQETLMIMLEFSPKLRQEPDQLLKSIRKMERVAKEKGEAMVSQINFHKDALVNQVEFTESGYKLKDSGKVQYSFYHRYEGNMSTDGVVSDEVENEMRESLVRRIKDRGSQVVPKGGNFSKIERVNEDLDGERSRENSKRPSLEKESREFIERNTLEKMILDNVGIDLSTQQTMDEIPRSQNDFSHTRPERDIPENTQELIDYVDQADQIQVLNAKQTPYKSESLGQRLDSHDESEEPEIEEIELDPESEVKVVNLKNSEDLAPEFQAIVNSINLKKEVYQEEVFADYLVRDNDNLMSSREFINQLNSGPKEVDVDPIRSVDISEESEYAREYLLYEGRVGPLLGKWRVVKKAVVRRSKESGQSRGADERDDKESRVDESKQESESLETVSNRNSDDMIDVDKKAKLNENQRPVQDGRTRGEKKPEENTQAEYGINLQFNKKRRVSEPNEERGDESEESGREHDLDVTKEEIDYIIEAKIQEIINEEVNYQREQKERARKPESKKSEAQGKVNSNHEI